MTAKEHVLAVYPDADVFHFRIGFGHTYRVCAERYDNPTVSTYETRLGFKDETASRNYRIHLGTLNQPLALTQDKAWELAWISIQERMLKRLTL